MTSGLAASRNSDAVLVAGGDDPLPERLSGARVTGNLFTVLKATAARGRLIAESDARPESPPVVLLGNGLWRRRFAGDPSIVGRVVTLDGVARTVIGVALPGFAWPRVESEFWIPFVPTASERNRA